MNPYPFELLNHFTVPVGMVAPSFVAAAFTDKQFLPRIGSHCPAPDAAFELMPFLPRSPTRLDWDA
jgi:hypothetical protein